MLFSKVLVIFVAFLFSSAIAAPTIFDRSDEVELLGRAPPHRQSRPRQSVNHRTPSKKSSKPRRTPQPKKAPRPQKTPAQHRKEADDLMKHLDKHLKPEHNKAVFWSGSDPSKARPSSIKIHAGKWAKKNQKTIINHTLAKMKIAIPEAHQNPHSSEIWDSASRTYAAKASGAAHSIIGHQRPGSVWSTIERPTLMANPAVTHIVEHDTVHNKVHTYDKATGKTTTVDGHTYRKQKAL